MMTEDYAECPECKYKKALTHFSSCGIVNWIACPKCRSYFEHGKKIEGAVHEKKFWENVERDTGFKGDTI